MTRYEEVKQDLKQNPKRWLVTGVAGFIGSNLLEELLNLGQHVVGLDNFSTGYRHNLEEATESAAGGSFHFIEGDIRDLDTCRRACENVDYVLHQAALGSVPRSIANPLTTHQVNVDGFVNMLVAARDAGVARFIFASSSSVYGDHPGLPKVEDQIGTPLSPYAVTKRTSELYAKTFFDHYGVQTIGLRYFNVFGRRQDPYGAYAAVIPKWIAQLLNGERCLMFGDGETSRDFCYVANVVQSNLLATQAKSEAFGRVYNIAVGERTTLNQLYGYLRDGLAAFVPAIRDLEPVYRDFRPGDIRHSLASIDLAREWLAFEPTHAVNEGLKEAMNWYVQKASMASAR